MYKNKKILAIIPARGGSKELPRKNTLPLFGKPLITWTIKQARSSKYIDELVVSTEDKKIAKLSKSCGANVPFLRPEELAQDSSPSIDLVLHALNWFEKKDKFFDFVVLLQPTSPLRKKNDIDNAIEEIVKKQDYADSLIAVGEIKHENPYILQIINKGYLKTFTHSFKEVYQRQKYPLVYCPYGAIYISKVNALKRKKTFYQEKTIPYFIERWQNYDIDDIYDFISTEVVLKKKIKRIHKP